MEPRLVVVEYLFKLYSEGKEHGIFTLENMLCPICGVPLEESLDGEDYVDEPDQKQDFYGDKHPIDLINLIKDVRPELKDKDAIFDSCHIGDIILNCPNNKCWTEAFFKETKLRVLSGTEEIKAYTDNLCSRSNTITPINPDNDTGLEGFFTHTE